MNEVHSPKKPLIFYYMVAMLLVMLFNFIAMPWLSQYQIQEVDYNTFVSMTEKGEIGRAEIQEADNRILFTSKDEKTIYKTAMISTDSQLVQRLLDAGVSTSGEEIEQTSLLMNILSWVAPILIFIALGQFMSRKLMQKMGRGCGAIGFAVYLAQLERFGRQTPTFDTDALILYDEASDPALIIRTARSWTDMGKTVRVQRQRGDLRCRQLIKIGAKEVSILETND